MDRELGRRRQWLAHFKGEQGYLLISTLFFLMFSGLFSHSIIKISGNQIMQLRQFSTSYHAKGALNMSEELLKTYIEENNDIPEQGQIKTSIGNVEINKESEKLFQLTITLENNQEISKDVSIKTNKSEEDLEKDEGKQMEKADEEDVMDSEDKIQDKET